MLSPWIDFLTIFMLLIRLVSLGRKEIGWALASGPINYYMTTTAVA